MTEYLTRDDYVRCCDSGSDTYGSKFCRLCDGALQVIGTLGGLVHYRCRGCGMFYSGEVVEVAAGGGGDE
jgi:hypothetical protein